MAKAKLEILKKAKADKQYYNGDFVKIAGNIWFFKYRTTYRASDAIISDLEVVMTCCRTDEILPKVKIFLTIRLDIFCVSKAALEEKVEMQVKKYKEKVEKAKEKVEKAEEKVEKQMKIVIGMKRVLDQLDDGEAKKKMKSVLLELESAALATDETTPSELEPAALECPATDETPSEGLELELATDETPSEGLELEPAALATEETPSELEPAALECPATAVVTSPGAVETSPDEDALSENIIAQINTFAENNGLKFYRNVAKINPYGSNQYTKYGLSRPGCISN